MHSRFSPLLCPYSINISSQMLHRYEQINGYRPSNCVHPIQPERHRGQWCRVTRDRWRMHDAGLLVFHARDVNPLDLPPRRMLTKLRFIVRFFRFIFSLLITRYPRPALGLSHAGVLGHGVVVKPRRCPQRYNHGAL